MKALIFNSGLGSRLGQLTENKPKSMVCLYNGESIFERQLRILSACGIRDFVVTTGPFPEQLAAVAAKFPAIRVTFVPNPIYRDTNYIYSMFLARAHFDDDFLLLHGDLVFNQRLVEKTLANPIPSLCLYHETKALPEKDFKCRLKDGLLREVSVKIFDEDCFAFQPLYKLTKADLLAWSREVEAFIGAGDDKVYAENALNRIADTLAIRAMSYAADYIDEVDTAEDLARVSHDIQAFD